MLWQLSAIEACEQICGGLVTSDELTAVCLERISKTDSAIGAWSELEHDCAIQQATAMDELRRRGRPVGPLHGVPVAISDDFNFPKQTLAPDDGGGPAVDLNVAVVEKLYEAGGVTLGKTVGSGLQFVGRDGVRNPHNAGHIAGGGAAAAVAAGHVPLSVV
ncbi:MAG: amidase family protein, partial [Hyphomicrobiaceae bacterium]